MTADEHKLMIRMFAVQVLAFKSLITALKSHEVLESDDLPAYANLGASEEDNDPELSKEVAKIYQAIAEECGIEIRFPWS
jgi:hypothetical protein